MESYENKTRVLYVLDTLKQRSGVTAVAMNYFRNIGKEKVHIDFLVLEDCEDDIVNEIKDTGSDVYFMPKLGLFNISKISKFYNDFFREHNDYKIVHSHFNQLDFIIFHYAKKNGVKYCISHSHSTKYSDYKLRAIRNWAMTLPIKYKADIWAACGIEAGKFLYGKDFLDSPKHLIINNAIDVNKFKFDPNIRELKRKQLGLNNKYVIGNVGSFKKTKNQKYILELFSELRYTDEGNKYHLLLVGDGELKEELTNLAITLNINEDVTFLGSRNDVNELLQAMDVFLLPSLYEGLPVIGIEAQASGLPCIFSDNVTNEVDVCNSVFLPLLDDKDKWVKKIKESENKDRKDTTDKIIENGFCIEVESDKLSQFYCDLK